MFRSGKICYICGNYIRVNSNDDIDSIKKIEGKPTCKECYYRELGKIAEAYPIGRLSEKKH